MPDHLRLGLGMLAFGQASEVLSADRTLKSPRLRQPALPFAVSLLIPTPVVCLLGRELASVVRPSLAAGEGTNVGHHVADAAARAAIATAPSGTIRRLGQTLQISAPIVV